MRWSIIRTFPLYGKSVWKWNKKFHNNLLPFLVCWIIDSLASAKNNYKHKHFSGEIRKLRRTVWSGSTKSLKWLQKVSTITAEPPLVLSSFLLLKTNINKKKYDDIPTLVVAIVILVARVTVRTILHSFAGGCQVCADLITLVGGRHNGDTETLTGDTTPGGHTVHFYILSFQRPVYFRA